MVLTNSTENMNLKKRRVPILPLRLLLRSILISILLFVIDIKLIQASERLPESRKLELNAYLTKPTTRLARYPLLLEAVLKHTPSDSSDKTVLPQAISLIRDFLSKVNAESGKTENRFNLLQLDQHLMFKPGDEVVCIIDP